MLRPPLRGRAPALVGVLLAGALLLVVGLLVQAPGERGRSGGLDSAEAVPEGSHDPARSGAGTRSGAGSRDPEGRTDSTSAAERGEADSSAARTSLGAEAAGSVARLTWEGQLLDASTKAPISGARVSLGDGERSTEARSDEDGRFVLTWFEGASADLGVEHPEYVDQHVADVELAVPGVLRLVRSARIFGRLQPAPDGPGAVALAWHQAASSHRYWSEFEAEVQTDGTFVIADLVPGQYAVSARVPEMSVPIEYGFQLEPGDDLEVRLEAMEGGVLFGKVVRGASFEPAADVEIQLRPGGKRLPPMLEVLRTATTTSAADGTYELSGLVPGSYRFTLSAEEGDVKRGSLDVPADGLRVERDFQLPGPAQVSGRVVDADGKAVPGARVVAFAMGDTQRTLQARTGDFDEDTPETFAGADGGFLLASAPTKRVLVVLAYPSAFDPTRDESVAPGSVVIQELEPGQIRNGIVIQIPPGESILGTVRSTEGEALSGVTISAQRYFGERYVSLGIVETDADGRFELHPLLPGKYRVLATTEAYWTNIEEAEVDGGIEAEVDIVLEHKESIRGIARDPDGVGIPDLPIRLRLDEDEIALRVDEEVKEIERPTTVYGRTDAFGRFGVDELYPGTWTVFGSSYGWELLVADPERLHVPAESHVELTFVERVRRERFAITGVVSLEDGGIPGGVRIDGLHGGFLEIDGGEFKATGLTPTRHNLWIWCEGHARTRIPSIDPVPGGTVDLGRIELWPTTTLTVKLRAKDGRTPDDARVALDLVPVADGGSPLGRRLVLTSLGGGRYRTNQATRHAWTLRVRHPEFRNVAQRIEIREQEKQTREIELR